MVISKLFTSIGDLPPINAWKRNVRPRLNVSIVATSTKEREVKNGIHPVLHLAHVKCATCGTELTTRWAAGDRTIDTCSQCHLAYTGRTARPTGGSRIERFERRRAAALH